MTGRDDKSICADKGNWFGRIAEPSPEKYMASDFRRR
jgi:hypothetical protein